MNAAAEGEIPPAPLSQPSDMCNPSGMATSKDVQLTTTNDVEKGTPVEVIKQAELEWSDVSYTLFAGTKKEKQVLEGVSGKLPPASLLAIMGPSGSGKSSLLNVLAGRVPITKKAKLSGTVKVNGESAVGKMRRLAAYCEQDEALFALSTVRETFAFAARLRLPPGTAPAVQAARVASVIAQLNLARCADTVVGNTMMRGVSGGERKRVGIGLELLVEGTALIFMDEPTSGLDSFQAQAVMQTLRDLATSGRTVLAAVHQPRSSIYAMLDQVMLLAGGKTAYFGGAAEAAERYFASAGHPIPAHFNPSDHFLDVICVDLRDEASAVSTAARVDELTKRWAGRRAEDDDATHAAAAAAAAAANPLVRRASLEELRNGSSSGAGAARFLVALVLLTRRSWRELTRDKASLVFKNVMAAFFSVVFGLVYFRMDRSQTSIQNRVGILFFVAMNQAFGSSISTSQQMPRQLMVVARERAAGMYGALPFYVANLLCAVPLELVPMLAQVAVVYYMTGLRTETPGGEYSEHYFFTYFSVIALENQCGVALGLVLSSLIKNAEMAGNIAPAVIVLLLLASGYFLNEDSIPSWLIWLKAVSFIRYSFTALCINEFKEAEFDCPYNPANESAPAGMPPCLDGDGLLTNLNFGNDTIWFACVCNLIILFSLHALAISILAWKRPHFLSMAAP